MRWIAAFYASLRALTIAGFAGSAQAQSPADADEQAWSQAEQMGTAQGYQQYLEQYPVGRHVEDAFRSLVEQEVQSEFGDTRGLSRGLDMY